MYEYVLHVPLWNSGTAVGKTLAQSDSFARGQLRVFLYVTVTCFRVQKLGPFTEVSDRL
jgi:hypothetical protein